MKSVFSSLHKKITQMNSEYEKNCIELGERIFKELIQPVCHKHKLTLLCCTKEKPLVSHISPYGGSISNYFFFRGEITEFDGEESIWSADDLDYPVSRKTNL